MTAQELIDLLSEVDPDCEVRLAQQPAWPFEYSIDNVVEVKVGADPEEEARLARADDIITSYGAAPEEVVQAYRILEEASGSIVYIVEGTQLAYLPAAAARALGWR